jgi:hypothetical protein
MIDTPTDTLERLLTDDAFRLAFREGRVVLPPEFGTIDHDQLESTARHLRQHLIQTTFRGSGGIVERFSRTLGPVLEAADAIDRLFGRFVASDAYRTYREWPRDGRGACLEEAFFRFAEAENLGDGAARERDFVEALVRAILLSPEPGFAVPPEIRTPSPGVAFGIARRSNPPWLCAATASGLVQGPVTALIVAVIDGGAPDAVAAAFGTSTAVVDEVTLRLRALGVI